MYMCFCPSNINIAQQSGDWCSCGTPWIPCPTGGPTPTYTMTVCPKACPGEQARSSNDIQFPTSGDYMIVVDPNVTLGICIDVSWGTDKCASRVQNGMVYNFVNTNKYYVDIAYWGQGQTSPPGPFCLGFAYQGTNSAPGIGS